MTVEECFEEWLTPEELPENGFNKTAMLDFAEIYHNQSLRIHDVVERSEQLKCVKCGSFFMPRLFKEMTICEKCYDAL